MDILVQVKEGQIEVIQSSKGKPLSFAEAPEAARFIAGQVARTAAPVNFHHSCLYPAEHGRPSFSKPAFVEEIKDSIYDIQSAERLRPGA